MATNIKRMTQVWVLESGSDSRVTGVGLKGSQFTWRCITRADGDGNRAIRMPAGREMPDRQGGTRGKDSGPFFKEQPREVSSQLTVLA